MKLRTADLFSGCGGFSEGLSAVKGFSVEYAVDFWSKALKEMVGTQEWADARKRNGWDDAYQNSADFTKFLAKTNDQYKEILAEVFGQ